MKSSVSGSNWFMGVVASLCSVSAGADRRESVGLLLAADTGSAKQVGGVGGANKTAGTFKTPVTALELLQNLKKAFDVDLFVGKEFYEDASLKSFFNAQRVKSQPPTRSQELSAEVVGNRDLFPGLEISVNRSQYIEVEYSGQGDVSIEHERVNVHMDVNVRSLHMNADMMKSVFGEGGKVTKLGFQDNQAGGMFAIASMRVLYGVAAERRAGVARKFVMFTLYQQDKLKEIEIVDEAVF
jgi:hypothetical protein